MTPPDLRLGKWQDVLADVVTCDSLICDPPYSQRVGEGFRSGTHREIAPGVGYGAMTLVEAELLASKWDARVRRWVVIAADHIAWQWHESAWRACDWYCFAPVPILRNGAAPRFSGDGPASQADYLFIARRKGLESDGSRKGWYLAETVRGKVTGAKDENCWRAVVRDYSRPGDLVVDPFCGSGTTAAACLLEGRRCITSEMDPATFEIARRRLARTTPDLFTELANA